jgi:putative endonuclease
MFQRISFMPARSNLKKKRSAYRFGLWAEVVAIMYYMLRGYRPIARRYKTKMGEVDLIVASSRKLIFIEVKARRRGDAMFPLHPKQLERIQHAAMLFVAKHSRFANVARQVDLLQVAPWCWPQCTENI